MWYQAINPAADHRLYFSPSNFLPSINDLKGIRPHCPYLNIPSQDLSPEPLHPV